MPEQEFEIYLSLLSKLLRLSPAQKAAISDELRDHLEQRLSDLLQTGLSREEAIKVAMDEFGDVSGLALDLTRVSRTPLQKVVVRSTIAASTAAVVIVGWITFFAPEHRIAAPVPVLAQPAAPPAEEAPARAAASETVVADNELFPEFLKQPTDVDFSDTPLGDVCRFLGELHDVPVMLHLAALQDDGIGTDIPVTLQLKGLTLEEVLNHLTRQLNLVWDVDGGIVRITAADSQRYLTRQFDLHPLIAIGHTIPSLVDVLHLATDGWEPEAEGTTALIGESIVVRQTCQNLRRIARVVAAIQQQQPVTFIETCTGRDRLLAALRQPSSVEFAETPLSEALKFLSDLNEVPILLDVPAVFDAGLTADTPVTLTLKNRPLGKQLELMLGELQLAFVLRDGVIRITTAEVAASEPTRIVYNVRDLVASELLREQLTDVIQRTTSGVWLQTDQGGGGDMLLTEAGGCLLVNQTDRVQSEIQALLDQLRKSRHDGDAAPAAAAPKLITKTYRMPSNVATDLSSLLPDLVAPESWKEAQIHLVAANPLLDHVDGIVSGGPNEVQVLKPAAPTKEGTAATPAATKSIVVRPRSMLIIRQTPRVHREIRTFLDSLEIPYELGDPQSAGRQPRGGFGGGLGGFGGMGGVGFGGMGGGGGFF